MQQVSKTSDDTNFFAHAGRAPSERSDTWNEWQMDMRRNSFVPGLIGLDRHSLSTMDEKVRIIGQLPRYGMRSRELWLIEVNTLAPNSLSLFCPVWIHYMGSVSSVGKLEFSRILQILLISFMCLKCVCVGLYDVWDEEIVTNNSVCAFNMLKTNIDWLSTTNWR